MITNTGQPISFDLTIATNPTAFFTQSGTGLGTATGITGTNNNILLPLTLTLDSINTGGLFASINITEALFGGVFNVDSLTANEITIDTGLGTGNVTGDFADTTTLSLNVGDNEVGNMRITSITLDGTAVPEPSSIALIGLAALCSLRRKR